MFYVYLVPESGTRQKLVPDCMTHVPETGTSFLVPVSGQYVMGITSVISSWLSLCKYAAVQEFEGSRVGAIRITEAYSKLSIQYDTCGHLCASRVCLFIYRRYHSVTIDPPHLDARSNTIYGCNWLASA